MATVADEIREANARWCKLTNSGDTKGLAQLYTEDCRVMAPNLPMMQGRDALEKFMATLIASGFKAEIESCHDVQTGTNAVNNGDTIWERGTLYNPDKANAVESYKFIVIWKRVNGSLQMFVDAWSPNQ